MTTARAYAASRIKRRHRSTQQEVEARREALIDIVEEIQPATVRQMFYQATVRNLIEKTEAGYEKIQRDLVLLRRAGHVPWGDIADNTRWVRKPRTWGDPSEALRVMAATYRKSVWRDAPVQVQLWIEKDALAGVVYEVTELFDVPLLVARGYSSLSFLYNAADAIREDGRQAFIYHMGDHDPSGTNAAEKINETLREFAPEIEITFERLAVLPEQIAAWDLPTRPTKQSDSRAKTFEGDSVELDAIDPRRLRSLVQLAFEEHMPPEQLEVLKVAEESERAGLAAWADALAR